MTQISDKGTKTYRYEEQIRDLNTIINLLKESNKNIEL